MLARFLFSSHSTRTAICVHSVLHGNSSAVVPDRFHSLQFGRGSVRYLLRFGSPGQRTGNSQALLNTVATAIVIHVVCVFCECGTKRRRPKNDRRRHVCLLISWTLHQSRVTSMRIHPLERTASGGVKITGDEIAGATNIRLGQSN